MAKRIVVFVEDQQYVGIWPSYIEGLRFLVAATDGGFLDVIDSTIDGWFDDADSQVTRHNLSKYTDGLVRDLVPAGWALIAVEDEATNLAGSFSGDMFGVAFKSDDDGVMCGKGGYLATSHDRLQSRTEKNSGTTKDLYAISFAGSDAFAVGQDMTVTRSLDDCATWEVLTSPPARGDDLYAVSFDSSSKGWATGQNGTIIKTTDGGDTWVEQTSGVGIKLYGVSFSDGNKGTAVGEGGCILRTTDGGDTWVEQTSGTTKDLWAVYFHDGNKGFAVGQDGTILTTIDAGTTWTSRTSGTTEDLRAVSMHNADEGWAVGMNDTILHTIDAGVTWTAETSPISGKDLFAVFTRDANLCFVVGQGGTYLHTQDSGTVWEAPGRGVPVRLEDFTHPDDAVYVFGDHTGLHRDFIQPDWHVFLEQDDPLASPKVVGWTGNPDVRDVIAAVVTHRFWQHGKIEP